MEQRGGPDEITAASQFDKPRGLDVLQFVDRDEMPVDQSGIGQWPEMLNRLQLW